MGAQKFNFAPKCHQNGGAQNLGEGNCCSLVTMPLITVQQYSELIYKFTLITKSTINPF